MGLCTTMYIQRVLFIPDSFSLDWGHSVHIAIFPIFGILVMEQYRILLIWRSAENYQNYGILTFFLMQEHMQLEISKCNFSHNFHCSPSKLMRTLVTTVNLNAC